MDREHLKHWMSTTGQKHRKGFLQGPSQNRSTIFTYKMVKLYHTKLEDLNPYNDGSACSTKQKK
jgi:hypothetical protein